MEQKMLDMGRRLVLCMILTLLFAGTAMGEVSRDGLVAEWHFDGDVKDSSGNGNDGIIYGATFVDGISGKALSFDGTNDYVDYGNIISNFVQFTFSAWIKIESSTHPNYMGIFGQQEFAYPTNANNWMFYTSPTNAFGTSGKWGDGTYIQSRVDHDLSFNEWHYIVQTYDGSNIKQYDNGELINSISYFNKILSNDQDFIIGKVAAYPSYGLSVNHFDGIIDEIYTYNRALSASEIQANYDAVLNPQDTNLPSISITSPSGGQAFDIDTIIASGTASDEIGLSKIEVKVDTGSWQLASGTISWSKSINLNSGSNAIYARATDTSGNTKETSVTISYTPPAVSPTPDPATTAPATPTPITQPTLTPKDSDGDGWSDEQEWTAGTNPNKADTDGDGIWDSKDSNPLVVEKTPEPINIQIQESEQKQEVEPNINVNVENTNINEDSGIEPLYIGIGAIGILLIGIIAVSSSRKGKTSSATNINIGKVGDSANRIVNDHSTTTNVDNRDGMMQRSNIGGSNGGIDEKLASLKDKYEKGLISEDIYKEMQKELLGKM